jgi:hypothetical protein
MVQRAVWLTTVTSSFYDARQGLRLAHRAKKGEARPVERIAKGVVVVEGGGEDAVVADQDAQDAPRICHP